MATKIYEIAPDTAITTKGVIFGEGAEVTAENFTSEEVFNALIDAGKIIEVTKQDEKSSGKKAKKTDEPSSSTGAAEPKVENTKPNGALL